MTDQVSTRNIVHHEVYGHGKLCGPEKLLQGYTVAPADRPHTEDKRQVALRLAAHRSTARIVEANLRCASSGAKETALDVIGSVQPSPPTLDAAGYRLPSVESVRCGQQRDRCCCTVIAVAEAAREKRQVLSTAKLTTIDKAPVRPKASTTINTLRTVRRS